MATIQQEFQVPLPAAQVWQAVRDFTAVHRLAAGFVTECVAEEEGAVRLVSFFNGMQVRERLVTRDDAGMRLVYTVEGGRATHYNASVQLLPQSGGQTRVVWTIDLLPDALAPAIDQMAQKGAEAMRSTLTPATH
jgi:carbon monoxide dehydrogenase subunit G